MARAQQAARTHDPRATTHPTGHVIPMTQSPNLTKIAKEMEPMFDVKVANACVKKLRDTLPTITPAPRRSDNSDLKPFKSTQNSVILPNLEEKNCTLRSNLDSLAQTTQP